MNTTQAITQYVAITGGTLAYELTGASNPVTPHKPLMVLAHGMGDDRRAFRFLAPTLAAAGHRVAAVDLRGCGESSTDWPSYTRTAIAGDLVALTEHLLDGSGPQAKAVLVGHSIAGGAATIAAATAPHLFQALVEVTPFTRKQSITLSDLRDGRFRRGMTHLMATTMLGSTKAWARYLDLAYPVSADGAKPTDYETRLAQLQAALSEPSRMKVLKKMGSGTPADAGAQLANVTCPVLIIQGSRDPDWSDPRAEGEKILSALPAGPVRDSSRLSVVEGSGHYPHVQHPVQVGELIVDFLSSLTGTASTAASAGTAATSGNAAHTVSTAAAASTQER